METEYYTSIIQITKHEAIADAGATGNFFLQRTPAKNVQPARKPIYINLPYGYKLSSTHIYNIVDI